MPMQIGIDELLGMLVSRLEDLAIESENQKSKFNIIARILYKKGLFNEQDALDAIKDEHKVLLALGAIKEIPSDEDLKAAAENFMLWIKGDTDEIKKSVETIQKRLQKAAEEQNKPKIDVAPAGVLNELDRLGANNKKIIL